MKYDVVCLYCGTITGWCHTPNVKSRCGKCKHTSVCDEAREVAAGMRPWARPLSFWIGFFGMKPMPDEDARIAQAKWDQEQAEIKERNEARSKAYVDWIKKGEQ